MFDPTEAQMRCCASHASYDELVEHLGREFDEIDNAEVAREVARAVAAADFTGLDRHDDRLLICELIARQQLQLLTGRRPDIARLDPQSHPARSGPAT